MAPGTMFTRTINVNLASSMKINENLFPDVQNQN